MKTKGVLWRFFLIFALMAGLSNPASLYADPAAPMNYTALLDRVIQMLDQLISANTVNPPGNEQKAVEIVAKRLDEAEIPYEITEFEPGRKNIVARLKGDGSKQAMLIMAHSDVVPTEGQAWKTDPFKLVEIGGSLYGRGVLDNFLNAAVTVELMIELKKSGTVRERDLIFAFTGDEERGGKGMQYLIKNRLRSIRAEFALNEGGVVFADNKGTPVMISTSVAEKTYQDFKIWVPGVAGHSSVPLPENAIYRLSTAMSKIGQFREPIRVLDVTREYFRARATTEPAGPLKEAMIQVGSGSLSESALATLEAVPSLNAVLRTTCVATTFTAGNAPNSLPADAVVNLNCRILPGHSIDSVQATLARVIDDPKVKIERAPGFGQESPESPIDSAVMTALKEIAVKSMGGVPVIPSLLTGASDSRFVRAAGIPCYGIGPVYITPAEIAQVHGPNEGISKLGVLKGIEFYHELVGKLVSPSSSDRIPNSSASKKKK